MSRIRSTHPGQWRDEDFVECGFAARLLALALRNEADDQGIFEWKPKQIKMSCFPADAVDVSDLLAELERNNIVKAYEIAGRKYGAIRNFRVWQRPKTPNSTHPVTEEILEYVGLIKADSGKSAEQTQSISEISSDKTPAIPLNGETVRNRFRNASEIVSQRKEVGGRREEEGGSSEPNGSGASAGSDDPPAWWPRRDRWGRIVSELTDKIVFDVGKAVLGRSSGGQIKKLIQLYRDYRDVTDLLLQAQEKSNPGEWIGAVIRNRERDCWDDLPALSREKYPEHSYQ